MRNLFIGIVSMASIAIAGCGSAVDNVGACNNFVKAATCGGTAPTGVDCSAYANTTCDISAYFTCLQGAFVCVNGMYDTTKLSMASTCASKATCP